MSFDTIASITAIVIGVCALGVSIWQGYETRKNYRLSVTPYIVIVINFTKGLEFGLVLQNKGVGPAVITKLNIKINGYTSSILKNPKDLEIIIDMITNDLPKVFTATEDNRSMNISYHVFDSEEMISAGDSLPIFWLDNSREIDDETRLKFDDYLSGNIQVEVYYKSIYGQSFSASLIYSSSF